MYYCDVGPAGQACDHRVRLGLVIPAAASLAATLSLYRVRPLLTRIITHLSLPRSRVGSTRPKGHAPCIPYKVKTMPCDPDQAVEVLVISSSKKRQEIMFPKIRGSSLTRTAFHGSQDSLGRWRYKSKSHDKIHEAVMFPLNVTEELYYWPEKALRTRKWVSRRRPNWLRLCFHWKIEVPSFCLLCRRLVKQISVAEAMAECKHSWMKEALARLVTRLSSEDLVGDDPVTAPTPNSSVVYIKRNEAIVGVQTTSGDLKSDVPPYVRAERFRKSVQICVFPLP
ncbi:hypothetical protein B296_00007478 [Ensete ventricosum]|uniref:Uncharacterized protein n=1 Tax=Ensete ventricosum TaxID=4639 RepID=A0A426ZXR2_ENSVE|nr:hypothetical protein B296_00007478 [Ensete ventricosum]